MQQNFQQQGAPMQNPMPQRPYIGFGEAIQICLNKYADFKGRASRAE